MKVLITGGSGNVGTQTVEEFLQAGYAVRVFDQVEPRRKGVEFVAGSVTEPEAVEAAMQGMDAVVHLAAIPAPRPGIPGVDFMHVNVTGTFNVLEAAGKLGVGKAVLASSDSTLGFVFGTHPFSPEYFPIDEAHPLRPQDPYGLSKLIGEEICKSATRKYGMDTVCLRFCWVWFADTFPQRENIVKGDPAVLAKTMWGYVDVRDAAWACRLAVELKNATPKQESVFITAKDTYMDAPSLELVGAHYPGVRCASEAFVREPHRTLFDLSRAETLLGYVPQHSWRDVKFPVQETTGNR